MSEWYDPNSKKYRTSLVEKIFYKWGWPIIKWLLFKYPSRDQAHHLGIYGIWLVGKIELIWSYICILFMFLILIFLRLLAFLPFFSWKNDSNQEPKS